MGAVGRKLAYGDAASTTIGYRVAGYLKYTAKIGSETVG